MRTKRGGIGIKYSIFADPSKVLKKYICYSTTFEFSDFQETKVILKKKKKKWELKLNIQFRKN